MLSLQNCYIMYSPKYKDKEGKKKIIDGEHNHNTSVLKEKSGDEGEVRRLLLTPKLAPNGFLLKLPPFFCDRPVLQRADKFFDT